MLSCPRCSKELTEYEHSGVKIDFCRSCGSTWFDTGEIASYFLTKKDIPSQAVLSTVYDEGGPRCPHDSSLLQQYRYISDDDLIVDVCPACLGVLLDRGEVAKLEKIAARFSRAVVKFFDAFDFDS
jgi:Zn-finger nucleic acid-binding protein